MEVVQGRARAIVRPMVYGTYGAYVRSFSQVFESVHDLTISFYFVALQRGTWGPKNLPCDPFPVDTIHWHPLMVLFRSC